MSWPNVMDCTIFLSGDFPENGDRPSALDRAEEINRCQSLAELKRLVEQSTQHKQGDESAPPFPSGRGPDSPYPCFSHQVEGRMTFSSTCW